MMVKQLVLEKLMQTVAENALNEKANRTLLDELAVAQAEAAGYRLKFENLQHVVEQQKKQIEQDVSANRDIERTLNKLRDAALAALPKLKVGTAIRTKLSLAIVNCEPFIIPF